MPLCSHRLLYCSVEEKKHQGDIIQKALWLWELLTKIKVMKHSSWKRADGNPTSPKRATAPGDGTAMTKHRDNPAPPRLVEEPSGHLRIYSNKSKPEEKTDLAQPYYRHVNTTISSPDFAVTRGLCPKGIQRILQIAFYALTAYIKSKTQLKCRTHNQIWKGCYNDKYFTKGYGLIPGQKDRGWLSGSPSPACTRLTFHWAARLHRPSGFFTGSLYVGKSMLKGIWNKQTDPPSPQPNTRSH